jgi:hypothetical protein
METPKLENALFVGGPHDGLRKAVAPESEIVFPSIRHKAAPWEDATSDRPVTTMPRYHFAGVEDGVRVYRFVE